MSDEKEKHAEKFHLPYELVGKTDLVKVIRELEGIDEFMFESKIRKSGHQQKPPASSTLLEELVAQNSYSLFNAKDRKTLLTMLKHISEEAPEIHISFAAEPTLDFMKKIVKWSRENLNPYVLVDVGLQPTIAVGCFVRTTNKVFDMSLRQKFASQRSVLIAKLTGKHAEAKSP